MPYDKGDMEWKFNVNGQDGNISGYLSLESIKDPSTAVWEGPCKAPWELLVRLPDGRCFRWVRFNVNAFTETDHMRQLSATEATMWLERNGYDIPQDLTSGAVANNGEVTRIDTHRKVTRRGKVGREKWRTAKDLMLELLEKEDLPKSIRATTALLRSKGVKYNAAQMAAHQSSKLREHFHLADAEDKSLSGSSTLLDELSGTLARQFRKLSPDTRKAIETEWKGGDKQKAIQLVETLSVNPDAGRTGDVRLIDNTDQDNRDHDRSE